MDVVKTIDDQELGFRFNNLTIDKYCRERSINFSDFDKDLSENILISNNVMFRCAIDVYSRGEKKLDEYVMEEIIEKMSQKDYNDILKALQKTMQTMVERFTGATESLKKK